jgi:hypothetical protein
MLNYKARRLSNENLTLETVNWNAKSCANPSRIAPSPYWNALTKTSARRAPGIRLLSLLMSEYSRSPTQCPPQVKGKINVWEGVGRAPHFLTSVLVEGERSASRHCRFTPREELPVPTGYETGWTWVRVDAVKKNLTLPGIEPGPSSPSLYKLHPLHTYCPQKSVNRNYRSSYQHCRSQWSRGLRDELSYLARTLGSWVRIPLDAWCLFVFILCLC